MPCLSVPGSRARYHAWEILSGKYLTVGTMNDVMESSCGKGSGTSLCDTNEANVQRLHVSQAHTSRVSPAAPHRVIVDSFIDTHNNCVDLCHVMYSF